MATISIDDMRAMEDGATFATSEWILVDQVMIDRFAAATGDHQFIHVNPEMAKMTPFGGTIAHGFLTVSLLSLMLEKSDKPDIADVKMSVNYGIDRLRFLTPVRSGSRVRGVFKHKGFVEKRPGQYQQQVEATVEIEGGTKPALIADWLFQIFA